MKTEIANFQHILVVLESSEDHTVPLARATRLCRALGAKMTLFISYYQAFTAKSPQNLADDLVTIVEHKKNDIDEQLQKWQASDYLAGVSMSWQSKPSVAIAKFIKNSDFDLVLKAPYQQSEFKHLFRSGLDKYFVSDCPLPLWLVKKRLWDDNFEVLSCVDMGDDAHDNHLLNRKILAVSDKLAGALDAEMHVVDCFYGEIGTMRIDFNSKRGFKREATIKETHVERLKLFINEYSLSDDVLHFVEGMPDHALPDKAADLSAEVAVIGNNEDTNYIDRIFGDTAVELVKAMPCDLLIVKPDIPN
ncbi:universal stress protein [Aliiglaciecola litoralis]|uniref:Universal stress protein UspE n=1 Tax=Aliiglaciecola litoralis TaxID=582857 RepID=A0ABP3X775_9ALTE